MAMPVTNAPTSRAAVGDGNAEVGAPDPVVSLTLARDALTPFREWTRRWLAARTADRRGVLMAEGVALAKARRAEFLRLIEDEPERALAEAVPLLVRQELPAEVLAWIEEIGRAHV